MWWIRSAGVEHCGPCRGLVASVKRCFSRGLQALAWVLKTFRLITLGVSVAEREAGVQYRVNVRKFSPN